MDGDVMPDASFEKLLAKAMQDEEIQRRLAEVDSVGSGQDASALPVVLKEAQIEVASGGYFAGTLARQIGRTEVDRPTLLAISAGVPLPAALQAVQHTGQEAAMVVVDGRRYYVTKQELQDAVSEMGHTADRLTQRLLKKAFDFTQEILANLAPTTMMTLSTAGNNLIHTYMCTGQPKHWMTDTSKTLSRCKFEPYEHDDGGTPGVVLIR